MPGALHFDTATLVGALLVMVRIGAAFALMPLPFMKQAPVPARLVFSLVITLILEPLWRPVVLQPEANAATVQIAGLIGSEVLFGIVAGLIVSLLIDSFGLAAQILGLQAGYGYASTIDPSSEADSGLLIVLAQLSAWLLFLSFGLDRQILLAIARSFEHWPPGGFFVSAGLVDAVLRFGATAFATAFRMALPVAAFLLLVDLAFAAFGKLNAQLQLLSLAFPVKMLAALALLAFSYPVLIRVFEQLAQRGVGVMFLLAEGR